MKIDKVVNINLPRANLTKGQGVVPQRVIDLYGVNMEAMVGYKGEKIFEPAPPTVNEQLAKFLNNLQVDWRTHISRKPKSM